MRRGATGHSQYVTLRGSDGFEGCGCKGVVAVGRRMDVVPEEEGIRVRSEWVCLRRSGDVRERESSGIGRDLVEERKGIDREYSDVTSGVEVVQNRDTRCQPGIEKCGTCCGRN